VSVEDELYKNVFLIRQTMTPDISSIISLGYLDVFYYRCHAWCFPRLCV